MVSSRRTGTNENISTYDSAGGQDFSVLDTWEATVDIDTTAGGTATTEVLEIHGGPHDDTTVISGGTHDATYPLIIRAAPGNENRWSKTSGARFEINTTDTGCIGIRDPSVYVQDIGFNATFNSATVGREMITTNDDDTQIVGCHCYDGVNNGAGSASGFQFQNGATNCRLVNCLSRGHSRRGINVQSAVGNGILMYNNTISDIVDDGLEALSSSNVTAINVIIELSNPDFDGTYNALSKNNVSEDGSHPGTSGTTGQATFTGGDFRLAASDTVARGTGFDLSSDTFFDFDDDIDGNTRSAWDRGGHEFQSGSGGSRIVVKRRRRLVAVRRRK